MSRTVRRPATGAARVAVAVVALDDVAVSPRVRGWDRVGWVEPTIGAVVVVVVGILALSGWAWATTTYRVTDTHVAPAVEAAQGLLAPFVEPSPL